MTYRNTNRLIYINLSEDPHAAVTSTHQHATLKAVGVHSTNLINYMENLVLKDRTPAKRAEMF